MLRIVTSLIAALLWGLWPPPAHASADLRVRELRCEYRTKPLGVDVREPRLSWKLSSSVRGQRQTAYRILVADNPAALDDERGTLWDSGKVASDQTIHVVYGGTPLKSGARCWWKVRAWDAHGEPSPWSAPASWSMGLIGPADWQAAWIAHARDAQINEAGPLPATMLRREFSVTAPIEQARVYVSGLGLYELHLNGHRVGDALLTPEFTSYDRRILYQCYDVTELLATGVNAVAAILGDGWHGEYFFGMPLRQHQRPFGGRRGFIMRLDIELADGTRQTVVTNGDWKATRNGPIRAASLYDGEQYDGRLAMPGWTAADFDDRLWQPVAVAEYLAGANLVWQRHEPIRVTQEWQPISLAQPTPGMHVFDLGQNLVGRCRIKVRGLAGTKVRLRHAERLNEDGTIYTANLRGATQTDTFIKGTNEEEVYEPRFTYHGFRYVEVTGEEHKPWLYMPAYQPRQDDLVGLVARSAAPEVSEFECSDERINHLMKMISWTQRGNMHSIPTDCPQRDERAGWMGDIQAYSQTAMFHMDMAAFLAKWLQDVRDSQMPDGRYPNFAPMDHARWKGGTPAWADAGVIVPWRVYQNYGDQRLLEEHYDSARRWIDFVHAKNPNLLWERDLGNKFNDWLNGDTLEKENWPDSGAEVPPQVLATAFFAHSTEIAAKMAAVLGHDQDAETYRQRFAEISVAFNDAYVSEDGTIRGDTQAGYALALRFNLLPAEIRPLAAQHMVRQFERYDGHMSTGIQTSHRLMLELTRNGYHDHAHRLLQLKTVPSWGFMAEQGATTVWERWDGYVPGRGFQSPRMNSFNHWALGSVGEWVWRHVVGLNPDEAQPSYKHFVIEPRPGGGLTWARGSYDSVRGRIESHWRIEGNRFRLRVSVPPNATATVSLPSEDAHSVTVDGKAIADCPNVKPAPDREDRSAYAVQSGTYEFACPWAGPRKVE